MKIYRDKTETLCQQKQQYRSKYTKEDHIQHHYYHPRHQLLWIKFISADDKHISLADCQFYTSRQVCKQTMQRFSKQEIGSHMTDK